MQTDSIRADAVRLLCGELSEIFAFLERRISPDMVTADLDIYAAELTRERQLRPLFHQNPGLSIAFPASVMTSINEEVVNAPPSRRRLKEGDLLKFSFGITKNTINAYQNWTYPIGTVSGRDESLCMAGKKALEAALQVITAGTMVSEISAAIETVIRNAGYQPGSEFVGHAMGRRVHESPAIACYVGKPNPQNTTRLKPGQILSIQVFVHDGDPRLKRNGKFTYVTKDGTRSVNYSQMVMVQLDGCECLTVKRPA